MTERQLLKTVVNVALYKPLREELSTKHFQISLALSAALTLLLDHQIYDRLEMFMKAI